MIPVGLNLKNKNVLLVGGGKVALRKAKLFLNEGAKITVVAPNILEELQKLEVTCIKDYYQSENLNNQFLVYACTDNKEINERIVEKCNALNILCGSATRNTKVSFNSMAFEETEIGTIALSTHQKMPYTKPLLKELTETLLSHSQQLDTLSKIRGYLVKTNQMNKNMLQKLYEVNEDVLHFIEESLNCQKGYIFVYHQSNYTQHYHFTLKPSIVLSLKEFEDLQDIFLKTIPYQVIPLLLSDGFIYQKLKKMTSLHVLKPLITSEKDICELVNLCRVEGRQNIWLMHPRSQTTLLTQIKNTVSKEDKVQTFNDSLLFEEDKLYHVVVLLMSEGEHYHDLIKQIPTSVSVSKILPLDERIKNKIEKQVYVFQKANHDDLEMVYALINERMDWMSANGIKQWEHEHYWNVFPKTYYDQQTDLGHLYVLKRENEVLGAVILLEEDENWENDEPLSSYYLHQFVASLKEKGLGKLILKEVEQLALKNKKEAVRLDCIQGNVKLNQYYENLGYLFVGECEDGIYHGNKREKRL